MIANCPLQLLNTKQAAKITGIAVSTLENWRCLGQGPQFVKLGRRVLYDTWDLKRWAEERRVSSTSERAPS